MHLHEHSLAPLCRRLVHLLACSPVTQLFACGVVHTPMDAARRMGAG